MTRKLQYLLTSFFIIGWFFLFGPSNAHAEEVTVQVTPENPSSDTSTATTIITVEIVEAKIEAAETALQIAAETQGNTIITTIQANVINTDTQTAIQIATTQEPIKSAVESATVKVQEANVAIQSAETAVAVAATAQAAVESQTVVVETAITNLNIAKDTLKSAQDILDSSPVIETTTPGLTLTSYPIQGIPTSTTIDKVASDEVLVVPTINEGDEDGKLGSLSGDAVMLSYIGDIMPFKSGQITFRTLSDDGVIVKINGITIINNWTLHGPTYNSGTYNFTNSENTPIEVLFYEWGGGAVIRLDWYKNNYWQVVDQSAFTTTTESKDPILLNAVSDAEDAVIDKTEIKETESAKLIKLTETATVTVQSANSLVNTAITKVNKAVSEMTNAAQVTVNYYAEQQAAAQAAAYAAAEAAARQAEQEAAAQAEADRLAAEAAQAEQEAKEKAEADAKAEADRLEAEAEAAAQAEADAKAEAEAKAQEEANAKAEAEAKAQEAADAKSKAEAKAAELEAAKKEAEELKKASEEGKLTEEQKEIVVEKILEDLKPGEAVSAKDIKEAGISYSDLPPATPVDVRTDENGNAVVITAAVAAQIELLQNPSALLQEAFTNPAAAFAALGSIGADMSDEERAEATDMVVATVVAAGAAINAAAVAAGGATGGGTGGGGSSGGGSSGANSPGSRGGRRW